MDKRLCLILLAFLLPLSSMAQSANERLIRSSIVHDLGGVMGALDKANINCKDGNQRTPLMLASKLGHTDIVIVLLDRAAKTDLKDADGMTALHHAAVNNQQATCQVLLDQDVNMEAEAKNGQTSLMMAAENGYHELMGMLLEKGAKPKFTLDAEIETASGGENPKADLINAILNHDEMAAISALERGAKPDTRSKRNVPVLVLAAARQQEDIVNALLDQGADVNIRATDSERGIEQITALHVAAAKGHTSILAILLARGATLNAQEKTGLTPLMTSSEQGHIVPSILLLDKGADPNLQDYAGNSPVLLAAANNHIDLVRILIEKGADVNLTDAEFTTPLMLAAAGGNAELVKLLLKSGADKKMRRGSNGYRALDFARVSGHKQVVQLLK